jgi:hypothetical protein
MHSILRAMAKVMELLHSCATQRVSKPFFTKFTSKQMKAVLSFSGMELTVGIPHLERFATSPEIWSVNKSRGIFHSTGRYCRSTHQTAVVKACSWPQARRKLRAGVAAKLVLHGIFSGGGSCSLAAFDLAGKGNKE